MLTIACHLHQIGDRVRFLTSDRFRTQIEESQIEFVPLKGNANYDYAEINTIYPQLGEAKSGIDRLNGFTKFLMGEQIPDQLLSIEECCSAEDVDLILVDHAFLGVFPLLLHPSNKRPAVVACGVTAPLFLIPESSPFAGPDDSPEGLVRNALDNAQFGSMLSPGNSHVDSILEKLGYTIPGGFSFDAMYSLPDCLLQLSASEFEFPSTSRPKNFRFVGPLVSRVSDRTRNIEWLEALHSREPVIFVTQGTLANYDFNQLIQPTIDGLANESVQVVVSAGGGDTSQIKPSRNCHIVSYIPYRDILPFASVFITNGGYNGVQEALSYGVPIVVAGATEDKPMVAARVQWSGSGIDLKTGAPKKEAIYAATSAILNDSKYRERAKLLRISFERYDAVAAISLALQEAIGVKHMAQAVRP
jgi:MGT family glycosyltransferase